MVYEMYPRCYEAEPSNPSATLAIKRKDGKVVHHIRDA